MADADVFADGGPLRWITPREAITMFRRLKGPLLQRGEPTIEQSIARLAKNPGNAVRTKAASATVEAEGHQAAEVIDASGMLPCEFWDAAASGVWAKDSDWPLGVIAGQIRVGDSSLRAIASGVRFCADDLEQLTGASATVALPAGRGNALVSLAAPPPPTATFGGKSSDKHGEPIARATLVLMAMTDAEFSREKGETIKGMLPDLYRRSGAQPPADKNLEGIAYGILRAVKEARKPAL